MTARPVDPKSRRRPICRAVALVLVMVAVLLASGCMTQTATDNHMGTISSSTIIVPTQKSSPLYKVTITQPNSSHAEIIKMDSDVYNIGEVVEFSVTNRSHVSDNCSDSPCSYRIAFQLENGSWQVLPEPMEPMDTTVEGPRYSSSCSSMRFATTNWTGGMYRIQYHCGVSRKFNLVVPLRPTPTRDFSAGSKITVETEPEYTVNNIRDILVFWNEKFHWDLSPTQIEEYAQSMENGNMKKYMTKPDYPHALFIPDEHQFYREVGGALGFNQSESEDFVRALDDYQRQAYQTCPSWEKCGTPKPIVLNFSVKPRPLVTAP
jgi:hypothetical protein